MTEALLHTRKTPHPASPLPDAAHARLPWRLSAPEAKGYNQFIVASPAMNDLLAMLQRAAQSSIPVFISGETGSGKEVVAQTLHDLGPRRNNAFVVINCASIPRELLESEIFGHKRGAFTGAATDHEGAAARAHHGTLFLDEITEMPLFMQAKLLRFIQTGSFTPVGSGVAQHADIRFVCATNRPPAQARAQGYLRDDLYFRLAGVTLAVPPLRARREDIGQLAAFFFRHYAQQERSRMTRMAEDCLELLEAHDWPGNVRELENTLRRAVVMHDSDTLTAAMLQIDRRAKAPLPAQDSAPPQPQETILPLEELERRAIERAIEICGGNITEAARRLQINPSTIHRKQKDWLLPRL
jgi:two-component system repressor protein LuxO